MADMKVSFAGIQFKNPLVLAPADHTHSATQIKKWIDEGVGGIQAKTLCQFEYFNNQRDIARYMIFDAAHKPIKGKIGQDISFMCRGSMMREEEGWMDDLADVQEYAAKKDCRIVGSLWGEPDWMAEKAKEMEDIGLAGIELDIGCPHLDGINKNEDIGKGVGNFIERCKGVEKVIAATKLPVTLKMASDVGSDWDVVIRHFEKIGIAGVTVHNRFLGFMPDIETQGVFMDTWSGIGGAWTLPLSCYRIMQVRKCSPNYPVIATNGGWNGEDIARYMLSGATLVAFATAPMLKGSGWAEKTLKEFEAYLDAKQMSAADLIGKSTDAALSREELYNIKKKPVFDHDKCVRCGICVDRCPWEALEMTEAGVQPIPWNPDTHQSCKGCTLCTMNCPVQAIHMEDR